MSGNTDGSSLGGMDGEMNENTGSVSLPGKNKFKSSSVWRCRCSGEKASSYAYKNKKTCQLATNTTMKDKFTGQYTFT